MRKLMLTDIKHLLKKDIMIIQNLSKKKHLSKLSKHIFLARDKNLMLLYVCLLCLTEKLFDINSFFDEHVVNLKSELINTSSFFK